MKNMVQGLSSSSFEDHVCKGFIFVKKHMFSFPFGQSWEHKNHSKLIHLHLCEPMKAPSLNGSRYSCLNIDNVARMTWVNFLKDKSKESNKFLKFKVLTKNMFRCFIKILHIDRWGEFISNGFESFENIIEYEDN